MRFNPTIQVPLFDRLTLNDIRDVLAESYGRDEDDRQELRLADDVPHKAQKSGRDRRWS